MSLGEGDAGGDGSGWRQLRVAEGEALLGEGDAGGGWRRVKRCWVRAMLAAGGGVFVFMGSCSLFDLERHFAFYGAYHSNPTNILIHMIFVWPILFTAQLILYFTPSLPPKFEFSILGIDALLVLNVGLLFTVIYGVFYICLDKKAGSLATLLLLFCWVASSFLGSWLGFSLAWKVVVVAQIVCWTGQFIGHGVFEALQTFAYEPYPGFHATVQAKVDTQIREWQEKKQK
ncbi:unnamed protein product [Linum tenue]|uniref:Uncharacterized protein n=1 Tax=Linum tenue TaxID=586396 RepID=A0AAV0JAH9_9ROSI|nr:unnamed protein product [Linum tenue]